LAKAGPSLGAARRAAAAAALGAPQRPSVSSESSLRVPKSLPRTLTQWRSDAKPRSKLQMTNSQFPISLCNRQTLRILDTAFPPLCSRRAPVQSLWLRLCSLASWRYSLPEPPRTPRPAPAPPPFHSPPNPNLNPNLHSFNDPAVSWLARSKIFKKAHNCCYLRPIANPPILYQFHSLRLTSFCKGGN